jgi:hypothetical protein
VNGSYLTDIALNLPDWKRPDLVTAAMRQIRSFARRLRRPVSGRAFDTDSVG